MNVRLITLQLECKKAAYRIPFASFSCFYGEMGAGKSTIARLIDFCFGGDLHMTPALQSEFISATLELAIESVAVSLSRTAGSGQVLVKWGHGEHAEQRVLPVRSSKSSSASDAIDSNVAILSDQLFSIAGINPPKVRKAKGSSESSLTRISWRNLLWFCYLDQDDIDSSFFNLNADADNFKRLGSRATLAYLLGYHQQIVMELEAELDRARHQKESAIQAAMALQESLRAVGFADVGTILERRQHLEGERVKLASLISAARERSSVMRPHSVDALADKARILVREISTASSALQDVEVLLHHNERHANEMLALATKIQRVTSARAVLNGVEYVRCPRCTQHLPAPATGSCALCGQEDAGNLPPDDMRATEADIGNRQQELSDMMAAQRVQIAVLRRRLDDMVREKAEIDKRICAELEQYDSAYLAQALGDEKAHANVSAELEFLNRAQELAGRVGQLQDEAASFAGREAELRVRLKAARQAAESDVENLRLLARLFLDCLIRARVPGFAPSDNVALNARTFFPQITNPFNANVAISSFDTLGSGGKKTLFKCCFAVALHRLARRLKVALPSFLIIDSPMKNISERENRTQFEQFHAMLYELSGGELSDVQFIVIDKEYFAPTAGSAVEVSARHMTTDDPLHPPLIEYYRDRNS